MLHKTSTMQMANMHKSCSGAPESGPTKGYYLTSLALWLVLFLRVSDAMTDWSVTFNYYFNWDQVVHESLANLGTLDMSFEDTDRFKQVNIYGKQLHIHVQ